MKSKIPHPQKQSPVVFLPALVAFTGALFAAGTPDTTSLLIAFFTAVLVALIGQLHRNRLHATVYQIQRALERFATGDLSRRVGPPPLPELIGICDALDRMASQIEKRMNVINQQAMEHEAILASMVEGVIALNRDAVILQANKAAAQTLGATPELIVGRSMYEMMRNHGMQKLVEQSLVVGLPAEGEIILQGSHERSLQVHSTALRNPDGQSIGALVVFNDITRLRRLERMRREFVANVSHELKTPLTSIRGFVETLLDGTLNEPEEARRFCKIIAKQVDRLQNIIEDLLSLSRIEQDVEHGQIALKTSRLADVIQSAVQAVSYRAAEKNARIEIECPADWQANINAPLFEQVLVNLLDNAIKYSESNKSILVRVRPADAFWEISVADQGMGIEPQHVDRIFERFYRIDKARSRKEGGTGLGLAIVKHIVVAHGGHINVQSKPGLGSTFTVCLPCGAEKFNSHHAFAKS